MKFQLDTADGVNVITRFDGASVWVGSARFDHSVLVPASGDVQRWTANDMASLTRSDFDRIAALRPEVVIFGSGATLRFAAASLTRALIDSGVGVEAMDTAAACRTFNVLASEGRRVVAALLVAQPG
jgi:uncharacterized protein